jgi:DNA-binding XRE family transcriptional regulator
MSDISDETQFCACDDWTPTGVDMGKTEQEVLRTFGARLRALREAKDLTQDEVAGLSVMSRSYLAAVEAGQHSIGVAKVIRLAAVLGVPPAEFFSGYTAVVMRRLFR